MKIIIEDNNRYEKYKKAMEIQKEFDELTEKVCEFGNKMNDILFDMVNE